MKTIKCPNNLGGLDFCVGNDQYQTFSLIPLSFILWYILPQERSGKSTFVKERNYIYKMRSARETC